jgi:exportin-T
LRNKLASTLAYLLINTYPATIPTFLHPFLSLLSPDPSSSRTNLQPSLLTVHLLTEIALEIHDSTMRSARPWSKQRQERDGVIRDVIRTSGDERLAVEGMMSLAEKGLDAVERRDAEAEKWLEASEQALRTLAMWTREYRSRGFSNATAWVDLTVALTPTSLSFFLRLLQQPITSLRILSASVIKTFVGKGVKEPSDRLQVLKVLNVLSVLDPLEAQTRDTGDDEVVTVRVALAGVLALYGTELILFFENVST